MVMVRILRLWFEKHRITLCRILYFFTVPRVSKLFNLLTDIRKAGRFVVVVVFVASAVYLVYLGSENCHYRFIREHSRSYKIHDINSVLLILFLILNQPLMTLMAPGCLVILYSSMVKKSQITSERN
jgi:hypothetical protein